MALIDEARLGSGICDARAGHDERSCEAETPADQMAARLEKLIGNS